MQSFLTKTPEAVASVTAALSKRQQFVRILIYTHHPHSPSPTHTRGERKRSLKTAGCETEDLFGRSMTMNTKSDSPPSWERSSRTRLVTSCDIRADWDGFDQHSKSVYNSGVSWQKVRGPLGSPGELQGWIAHRFLVVSWYQWWACPYHQDRCTAIVEWSYKRHWGRLTISRQGRTESR